MVVVRETETDVPRYAQQIIARENDWEVVGVKKPWWDRTYQVPRWLVWLAAPQVVVGAVRGVYLIAGWFS